MTKPFGPGDLKEKSRRVYLEDNLYQGNYNRDRWPGIAFGNLQTARSVLGQDPEGLTNDEAWRLAKDIQEAFLDWARFYGGNDMTSGVVQAEAFLSLYHDTLWDIGSHPWADDLDDLKDRLDSRG